MLNIVLVTHTKQTAIAKNAWKGYHFPWAYASASVSSCVVGVADHTSWWICWRLFTATITIGICRVPCTIFPWARSPSCSQHESSITNAVVGTRSSPHTNASCNTANTIARCGRCTALFVGSDGSRARLPPSVGTWVSCWSLINIIFVSHHWWACRPKNLAYVNEYVPNYGLPWLSM